MIERRAGGPTVEDLVDKLKAELVELVAEQQIEHEHLAYAVGDEGELNEEVEHHEVVAEELAADTADGGEQAPHDHPAPRLLAPTRVVAVLVHGREHVAHVLLADLVLVHGLVVARRLHDVPHVDAGAARERAPGDVGNVEEEGLREQDERHPLVVLELEALADLVGLGQLLVQRDVVGVGHPADVVDVLFVVAWGILAPLLGWFGSARTDLFLSRLLTKALTNLLRGFSFYMS